MLENLPHNEDRADGAIQSYIAGHSHDEKSVKKAQARLEKMGQRSKKGVKKAGIFVDQKVKDGIHFGWTAKREVYGKMETYPQAMKLATIFVVVLFLSSAIINSGDETVTRYADAAMGFVLSPVKVIRAWNIFRSFNSENQTDGTDNKILADEGGSVAGVFEANSATPAKQGQVKGEKITDGQNVPELISENFKVKEMNFGGDIVTVADQAETGPLEISEVKSDTLVARTRDKEESKLLISWRTNKLSTSEIEFYKSGDPGNVRRIKEDNYGFSHSVILSDLEQGVAYNYTIKVRDRWGNELEPGHYAAYSGSKKVSTLDLIMKALGEIFGWVANAEAKK